MKFNKIAVLALFSAVAGMSQASTLHFSGEIATQKDVIVIPFTLDTDTSNVRVWTDSYLNGVNFDPVTAVWQADGALIRQNDDDSSIAPGQGFYDSGLVFDHLAAGKYFFTIATFNNFAVGGHLSDGFLFDSQAAIPLARWCQPSSQCGMGAHFSVHLEGVSSAVTPSVPEPASYTLLMSGLGLVGFFARRRKTASRFSSVT